MSKFQCKCGEILSNSLVPNDIEFWAYSDREWDKIMEQDTYNSWEIPRPYHEVWKCPACQRIYIFENNQLIRTYIIEQD
jgi:hypothetical protein